MATLHAGAGRLKTDSDRDGLPNRTEVKRTKTNPYKADSDGDGFNDGEEVAAGSDPRDPASAPPPAPDKTPPNTSILSGPASITASVGATISFTSSETGSTFMCRLDGSAWGACASPKTFSGLTIGGHLFSVRAVDAAGNTDPTPATLAWTVETPPPPITTQAIWAIPDNAQVGVPVTLDGTASTGYGPLSCTWSFEDSGGSTVWQTRSGCKIDFTFESDGLKYVKLTVDGGNGDTSVRRQSFGVAPPTDTTAPDTSIDSGPPATSTASAASFGFSRQRGGLQLPVQAGHRLLGALQLAAGLLRARPGRSHLLGAGDRRRRERRSQPGDPELVGGVASGHSRPGHHPTGYRDHRCSPDNNHRDLGHSFVQSQRDRLEPRLQPRRR